MIRDKFVKMYMKALEIHRDVLFSYDSQVEGIKRNIKSSKQIRVLSFLYNEFLLIYTYADIIFRYTIDIEKMESYKNEISAAEKSMKDIYKEIKSFDEDPDTISIYVRCQKDKIRKALKESDIIFQSLSTIADAMERDCEMTDENFKALKKMVKLYTLRSNALSILLYSMKVLLKYKEV